MDLAGFERLGAHLSLLDEYLSSTAGRFGFARQVSGVGLYPRRRFVRKDGPVSRWVDLCMGLDSLGRKFEVFDPSLSYELGCGAFIDNPDQLLRSSIRFLVFEGQAFDQLEPRLQVELEAAFLRAIQISESQIRSTGERTALAARA